MKAQAIGNVGGAPNSFFFLSLLENREEEAKRKPAGRQMSPASRRSAICVFSEGVDSRKHNK
jgi:hypothetical protein